MLIFVLTLACTFNMMPSDMFIKLCLFIRRIYHQQQWTLIFSLSFRELCCKTFMHHIVWKLNSENIFIFLQFYFIPKKISLTWEKWKFMKNLQNLRWLGIFFHSWISLIDWVHDIPVSFVEYLKTEKLCRFTEAYEKQFPLNINTNKFSEKIAFNFEISIGRQWNMKAMQTFSKLNIFTN